MSGKCIKCGAPAVAPAREERIREIADKHYNKVCSEVRGHWREDYIKAIREALADPVLKEGK